MKGKGSTLPHVLIADSKPCGKLNPTVEGISMADSTPRSIVYIEDDHEMIDLVSLILSRRGYQVYGSPGGRQGLELATKILPDLILLDLMMPDMDGWDVFHQLKANPNTQNIPIIVITAKSLAIDRVLGIHIAKVDDYISKPFHPQELQDSIEKVLNAHAAKSG